MKKTTLILFLLFACFVTVAARPGGRKHKAFYVKKYSGKSFKAADESTFKKIEYNFSSSSIRPGYVPKIDQLAKLMTDGNYALALRGYADSIGNYTANWHLSEKRANVLKQYLVKKGVDENHIITTAFGSTKPVSTNKTAIGRQRNRRVEIQLNKI